MFFYYIKSNYIFLLDLNKNNFKIISILVLTNKNTFQKH